MEMREKVARAISMRLDNREPLIDHYAAADAVLAAMAEPTEEMVEAAKAARLKVPGGPDGMPPGVVLANCYRAMIAAAATHA